MPRLLGVDIPNDRSTVVSLTYLYGVGRQIARELCHKAGVDPQAKARDRYADLCCGNVAVLSLRIAEDPRHAFRQPASLRCVVFDGRTWRTDDRELSRNE